MRLQSYQNITTEEGKLLRCNRSIQAEGAFGQLKHNRSFQLFLTGGNIKVLAELLFFGAFSEHCTFHFQVQQRFTETASHPAQGLLEILIF